MEEGEIIRGGSSEEVSNHNLTIILHHLRQPRLRDGQEIQGVRDRSLQEGRADQRLRFRLRDGEEVQGVRRRGVHEGGSAQGRRDEAGGSDPEHEVHC